MGDLHTVHRTAEDVYMIENELDDDIDALEGTISDK